MPNDADLDLLVDAIARGAAAETARAAQALGLDLSPASAAELTRLSAGSLTARDVLLTVVQAVDDPAGLALREVRDRTRGFTWGKHVCLAVRCDGHVTVAVAQCNNLPTRVSEVWPVLRPWYREPARNRARCEAWARAKDGAKGRVRVKLAERAPDGGAGGGGGARTEADLLRAVRAAPDDLAPRLVLADWLDERGDVRGRFVRVQCELESHPRNSAARKALEAESERLVRDYGPRLAGEVAERASAYEFRWGLPWSVTMNAGAFRKHGARLFDAYPIRRLWLNPINDEALAKLAACPDLERVRELSLSHGDVYREKYVRLAPLRGCRYLRRLEALDLSHWVTDPDDYEAFFAALDAPSLRSVRLDWGTFTPRVLAAVARNPTLGALRAFSASNCCDLGYKRTALRVRGMTTRAARAPEPDPTRAMGAALAAVGASPTLGALAELDLGSLGFVRDEHVAALVAGPNGRRLERLDLSWNGAISDAAMSAVAASQPRDAPTLRRIAVSGTKVTDAGLVALLASPAGRTLESISAWVDLTPAQLGAVARAALALPDDAPLRGILFNGRPDDATVWAAYQKRFRAPDEM